MAKTTRKEVTLGADGPSITGFVSTKSLKKGQEIEGIYLGSFVGGKFGTTTHKVQLAAGKIEGVNNEEAVTMKKGDVAGINGSGQLNKKLEKIAIGTAVAIVYDGQAKIEKGEFKGTLAHQFRVFDLSADGGDQADYSDEAI